METARQNENSQDDRSDDALRVLDLLDRGHDPDAAPRWMNSNGYGTQAVDYPSLLAIGFPYQYMALVNGAWEHVHRLGA